MFKSVWAHTHIRVQHVDTDLCWAPGVRELLTIATEHSQPGHVNSRLPVSQSGQGSPMMAKRPTSRGRCPAARRQG